MQAMPVSQALAHYDIAVAGTYHEQNNPDVGGIAWNGEVNACGLFGERVRLGHH